MTGFGNNLLDNKSKKKKKKENTQKDQVDFIKTKSLCV